jgi:hypothetical protein
MTTPQKPMLHCILRHAGQPLTLPAGVREIRADGLAAVVSDVDPQLVRAADRPALQGYADLIAGLHRNANLIPMRFGCVLDGDPAVLRFLDCRRARLATLLDRLDGCVELGIRLLLPAIEPTEPDAAPPAPRPGHAHLDLVRRRIQGDTRVAEQARAVRERIESVVAGLFRDARDELGQIDGHRLLSLYYLVPRESCDSFVGALRLAPDPDAEAMPNPLDGRCLVSGPWPPYNFVGAIDDDLRCLA